MDDAKKRAYRQLLYWALVEVRGIEWTAWSWNEKLNPFAWIRNVRRVRAAGAIADWLHNLALFSALDFERFDEEHFWADYSRLVRRYGRQLRTDYRKWFDQSPLESGPPPPQS